MRYTCGWAIAALIFATGCLTNPSGETDDPACDDDMPTDQRVGEPCTAGSGESAVEGEYVCTADGSGTECDAEAATGNNGNNTDDCTVEGGELGDACTTGVGACEAEGVWICGDDGAVCDAAVVTPGEAELCGDGIDNDCDGELDEGFDMLGEACTSGEGVCAVEGTFICSEDGLTAVCDAVALDPAEAEEATCDGLDNDCDAAVDEGCDDDADGYCDAAMTHAAGAEMTCASGAGDCDDENDAVNPAGAPACDGIDNNCDGKADNLLPTAATPVDLPAPAQLVGLSSIFVAPGDDGFCVVLDGEHGADDIRYRGYYDTTTATLTVDPLENASATRPLDIIFAQDHCIAAVVGGGTLYTGSVERWSKNLTTVVEAPILPDKLYLPQGWAMSLAANANTLVVGYMPSYAADTQYVTVPLTFGTNTGPSEARTLGPPDTGSALIASPIPGEFLYMSDTESSRVATSVTLGNDASEEASLAMTTSAEHGAMIMGTVGGETYLATFVESATPYFEIQEISSTLMYGRVLEIPVTAVATNEFINRKLFAAAPGPALAMFANPVEDRLQIIADDGAGSLSFDNVDDSRGDLLAVRDAGSDVYEAVWMTTPGNVAASENAKLEVVQYTCH